MDNTLDALQIKIDEAKSLLTKQSREAIDAVNWKYVVQGMSDKYSVEQIEDLTTITELLLCGLIKTGDYPKELKNRMLLTDGGVDLLLNQLDLLIFKKIQVELENKILGKGVETPIYKPLVLDPRFISMPKDIQESIARSDWKNKIYEISKKYKINIEQMGILEDLIVKVIQNTIHPDKFEGEVNSKITISKDDISNLIKEINNNILLKIREGMKNKEVTAEEEKVPVPPYANITPKKVDIINDLTLPNINEKIVAGIEFSPLKRDELKDAWPVKKEETIPDMTIFSTPKNLMDDKLKSVNMDTWPTKISPSVKDTNIIHGVDTQSIMNDKLKNITMDIQIKPTTPIQSNTTIHGVNTQSIMNDKLKSVTMSDHTVSDYSTPKLSNPSLGSDNSINSSPKSHDPYRETF
jgi:hypothetical protein